MMGTLVVKGKEHTQINQSEWVYNVAVMNVKLF